MKPTISITTQSTEETPSFRHFTAMLLAEYAAEYQAASDRAARKTARQRRAKPGITVAYIRSVSHLVSDTHRALRYQQQACQDYARRLGLRVSTVYADVAASDADEKRPMLDRLLYEAKQKRIDRVVIATPDALASDARLRKRLRRRFRRHGVNVTMLCDYRTRRQSL